MLRLLFISHEMEVHDTMVNNYQWRMYPGNDGLSEPLYVLPDYIYYYMPWARVIFTLRNPVDRFYVFYISMCFFCSSRVM